MKKTNYGENTPGGMPGTILGNPPSFEAGLMDSGGDHLLLIRDRFKKCGLKRTPPNSPSTCDDLQSFQGNDFEYEKMKETSVLQISENQLRTNLEKMLWSAWQRCISENHELRILVNYLQSKVDSLLRKEPQNAGNKESESSNS